jgi:N-methylhydantoinase A
VLGRLDPARLLAVDRQVGLEEIRAAMVDQLGRRLGLDAEGAAAAILRVANDRMAGAIRMVSLARGHDPRDYALFAFGGAGPLHAGALAKELAIPTVLIPARPGITNAIGCVVADLRHDHTRTLNRPLEASEPEEVAAILSAQAEAGRRAIVRDGVPVEAVTVLHAADMQFRGQTHLLTVPLAPDRLGAAHLRAAFERAYLERFGIELPEIGAMVINLKTSVVGRRRTVDPALLAASGERAVDLAGAAERARRVWFADGWQETPVYRRERLPLGATFTGPAIVEQLDTTIVVEPGDRAHLDPLGNLVLRLG